MTIKPTLALAISCMLGVAACGMPVEDTRPGQPVKTRQTAFKEMLRAFEPMGKMLRSEGYQADKFELMATRFMATRDAPWTLFGADTHYPPTKAKAEVWSRKEDFEREKQAFLSSSDALRAAAKTRQEDVVKEAYFKVYDQCESCHKTFKEK